MPVIFVSKEELKQKKAQAMMPTPQPVKKAKTAKVDKSKSKFNFAQWYEQNKEDYNRKRRERYQSDPEYKAKVRKGAERWRLQNKKPVSKKPPIPEGYYDTKQVAAMLDRNVQAIRHWEKEGYIPSVDRDSYGRRVYSEHQVKLMRYLVDQLDEIWLTVGRGNVQYKQHVGYVAEQIKKQWND